MIAERVRRTTTVRRAIVVVFVLGVAGMLAVAVSSPDAGRSWQLWVAFVVTMAVWFGARFASDDIAEGRADRLDERELLIRYRATRIGFQAILFMVLTVATVLMFLQGRTELTDRSGWVLFAVISAGAALPTMLLCWRAPEPDPED